MPPHAQSPPRKEVKLALVAPHAPQGEIAAAAGGVAASGPALAGEIAGRVGGPSTVPRDVVGLGRIRLVVHVSSRVDRARQRPGINQPGDTQYVSSILI